MSIITDALPQLCEQDRNFGFHWPHLVSLGLDAGDEWALKSLLLETTTTLVEVRLNPSYSVKHQYPNSPSTLPPWL